MNPSDFSLTDRITTATNNAQSKVDKVSNAAQNVQNRVNDQVNRVSDTVDNAEKGLNSALNLGSNLYDKAGETFNKATDGFSSLSDKIGNLFGGSDIASTGGVKTAGSGGSGASPSNKIAAFASNPKDSLPSLDPLKREVAVPFKAANEAATGAIGYLKPTMFTNLLGEGFNTLRTLRDKGLAAVGTDFASVKNRIEQTMNVAGQLAKLPGDVKAEINGYVTEFNNTKMQVQAVIDETTQTFDSFKDLDDYLAIDNFLTSFKSSMSTNDAGGYTSTFTNMDISTVSAVVYGISSKLSEYNLPAKTEPLFAAVTDPVAQAALYREMLVQASGLGSLPSVEYYLDKVDAITATSIAPELVVNLMMNMQIDTGAAYKDYGSRLLAIFLRLDPKWDKRTVDSVEYTELYPYTFANANAIQSLLTTDRRKYVIASGSLSYDSVATLVNRSFSV